MTIDWLSGAVSEHISCEHGLHMSPQHYDVRVLRALPHKQVTFAVQFPKGFEKASLPSGKGYIRTTPQPNLS